MHKRTPLRMGPLRFRDPVLLCGVLYGLLLFDASGFLRPGLLAAFLHEWGHILVYCAQQRRFPVIEVTLTGFCMRLGRAELSPARGGRSGGKLCAGRGVGRAAVPAGHRAGQRVLGGKPAHRGVQPSADSAVGRGPDAGQRGAAAGTEEICPKRLQKSALSGKMKRTHEKRTHDGGTNV